MVELNVGKLADDLQSLVSDAEELLRATAGVAGEKASEARDRVRLPDCPPQRISAPSQVTCNSIPMT